MYQYIYFLIYKQIKGKIYKKQFISIITPAIDFKVPIYNINCFHDQFIILLQILVYIIFLLFDAYRINKIINHFYYQYN